MLSHLSTYVRVMELSDRTNWMLQPAIDNIDLDFSSPFLPDVLMNTTSLSSLSEPNKLLLNHICAYAYVHMFQYIEELIIAQILIQSQYYTAPLSNERRALLRFCDEEIKHQRLFEAFKNKFNEQSYFKQECDTIKDSTSVAINITSHNPLAVMLLISLLEWITQQHYRNTFNNSDIDSSFARLFELHWFEEAQHTELDSLEINKLATKMSVKEREEAVDELFDLCFLLDGLLIKQALCNVDSYANIVHMGKMKASAREQMVTHQINTYRWIFIGCGFANSNFIQILEDIAPNMMRDVIKKAALYQ
jgi:hypothetical protein